ncbi:MAG: menaquinone biosynthetic enzyme MqnA/MqnD family protein [Saprospiraceae bacterium]
MNKIRLSAVSYLNTKPFLYGIFKHKISLDLDIQLDIPAVCAAKLESGAVDLALVPVAVLPQLSSPKIITDYCIATEGRVRTVCLFGETPIEEWDYLYMDFHSRSSVQLSKLLLKEYWGLNPVLLAADEGFIEKIKGKTGGLVIGDRTFPLHDRFPYIYDLGEAWMNHRHLPFVFAAWVTCKKLAPEFIAEFSEALAIGLDSIPQLVSLMPDEYAHFDLSNYFTENIKYEWDMGKREALSLFLGDSGYNTSNLFETSVITVVK